VNDVMGRKLALSFGSDGHVTRVALDGCNVTRFFRFLRQEGHQALLAAFGYREAFTDTERQTAAWLTERLPKGWRVLDVQTVAGGSKCCLTTNQGAPLAPLNLVLLLDSRRQFVRVLRMYGVQNVESVKKVLFCS